MFSQRAIQSVLSTFSIACFAKANSPLMIAFSRPLTFGWKPDPSSSSVDRRPDASTVPSLGRERPAITRSRVLVQATYHGRLYRMKVNKCSGEVYDIRRIKKHKSYDDGFYDDTYGTGFGFQFRFGNDNGY